MEFKGVFATLSLYLTGLFTPAMVPASIWTAPLQDAAFMVTIVVGLVTLAKLFCWFKDRWTRKPPAT